MQDQSRFNNDSYRCILEIGDLVCDLMEAFRERDEVGEDDGFDTFLDDHQELTPLSYLQGDEWDPLPRRQRLTLKWWRFLDFAEKLLPPHFARMAAHQPTRKDTAMDFDSLSLEPRWKRWPLYLLTWLSVPLWLPLLLVPIALGAWLGSVLLPDWGAFGILGGAVVGMWVSARVTDRL